MNKVLILGGYGNFGKRIATALTLKGIPVIIAGRNDIKARAFAATLPETLVEIAIFDATRDLARQLDALRPAVVVNTCGPFQTSDYSVADTCIANRVHYIDLADGRDFVTGISVRDDMAKAQDVAVISGASTVPGLSSAVIEAYRSEFSVISDLRYGISPGQKAERGLATTKGIMTYVGKPLRPFAGSGKAAFGWQDIYRQKFPVLGPRWMANCDVPDLDLFPLRYGIGALRFSAGLELSLLHLGLWGLSWIVRAGVPLPLPAYAEWLLKISNWFDIFGSADGGMYMVLSGLNAEGKTHQRRWFIIAKNGDGPQIPTIPAIVLAEKLARGAFEPRGAMACVGLVTLNDYLNALREFDIEVFTDVSGHTD